MRVGASGVVSAPGRVCLCKGFSLPALPLSGQWLLKTPFSPLTLHFAGRASIGVGSERCFQMARGSWGSDFSRVWGLQRSVGVVWEEHLLAVGDAGS